MSTPTRSDNQESHAPSPPTAESVCDLSYWEKSEEMFKYLQNIDSLARSKSSEIFSNGAPAHAAIIFITFFKYARHRVNIYCQKLAANVFGLPGVMEAAREAAGRNVWINVVSQTDAEPSVFRDWLMNPGFERVRFKEKADPDKKVDANYATMDGVAYRMEPDVGKIEAYACMNNPGIAGPLEKIFGQSII